jgi:hypothetical protein
MLVTKFDLQHTTTYAYRRGFREVVFEGYVKYEFQREQFRVSGLLSNSRLEYAI